MRWSQIIWIAVFACHAAFLSGQIRGVVSDNERHPLTGATVVLLPDSTVAVSDLDGRFSFQNVEIGPHTIHVSFLGYTPYKTIVRYTGLRPLNLEIKLQLSEELLNTIIVTGEHAKQESSLSVAHISDHLIDDHSHGTFAKSLESLPGINAINVGTGIAKPVIRGLSSNRIIVNQQGIKQESHQWGADHGLEVDQYDVERVEIIKGPASLQYGSDGLGGVINIMPGKILPAGTIAGSAQGVYKTNNDHYGGSVHMGLNWQNNFFSARYSRQSFGDYEVPANNFIYNGFTLPIYNNRLKNTSGQETNLRMSMGIQRDWGIGRIHFNHYTLEAGLFSGAVGIPRSYTLTDDGNRRDIDIPNQKVDHYRLSIHQTLLIGDDDHLDFNLGYQKNIRREFSFPEFHSIPASQLEPGNNLALQFELRTLSGNVHYEHRFSSKRKLITGGNVQWQRNTRTGFEFLLPDFQTFRYGLFGLTEWQTPTGITFNAGLRLDLASNDTEFFRQWVWNSNEMIIDSLVARETNDNFFNWSASLGMSIPFGENKWILKTNLGKSFRIPYPAETVSNGIHHGTFRHEVGNPDLTSEHGYQVDISAEFSQDHFRGSIATYVNYFNNYIYLGPTFPAEFSSLPEAGQLFKYRQDDALYTGFELEWEWHLTDRLEWTQSADFVYSHNISTGLALPFTPQPSFKNRLHYLIWQNKKGEHILEVSTGHNYSFPAEGSSRIDRSERPTPGYHLWDAGAEYTGEIRGQEFQLNLKCHNVFNTFYFNHLSRYRLINVPEQGRNIVISLKVPFSGQI